MKGGRVSEECRIIPYIGVSDIGSNENIVALRPNFSVLEPLALKAGLTMTRKVLWGIQTKWNSACPSGGEIRKIFATPHPRVIRMLHYADYDGVDLVPSLKKIMRVCGKTLDGIQLDMVWPDPFILEKHKKVHTNLELILQVGEKALIQVGENPLKMWRAIQNYDGIVDRILLDRSGGNGKPLAPRSLIRFVDILYERMPALSVVVAGGLGPLTLHLIEPLLAMYPGLSIDAQGQLRESGKTLDGPISLARTRDYVFRSTEMYWKYNPKS